MKLCPTSFKSGLAKLDSLISGFLPDCAEDSRRESGAKMTKRPRRNHTPAFKAKVALAASRATRLWPNWHCSSTSPNQITQWKGLLLEGAADVFGADKTEPKSESVDLKALHAKIGELTLKNDFLEGAFTKAGLLSAKR
jgi:transposase